MNHREEAHYGALFWAGVAVGWAFIAFAIWGVFHTAPESKPVALAEWILGGLLVHDLVVAPLAFVVGYATRRRLRGAARAGAQFGLIVSALILAYAFPLLFGFGRRASTATVQPQNYTLSVIVVLSAVWVVAFAVVLVRARRSER